MLKSLLRHSENHLEILQLYVVAADFSKMLARMNHPVSAQYLACFQRVKSWTFELSTEPDDGNDLLFLDDILSELANTKIPNLEKMARAAKEKKPFNLYNKDTCMEFHELLCEIFERFHESLNKLKYLHKLTVNKRKRKLEIGQPDLEAIVERLHQVLALGRALKAIVRGSAIKMHLTTISPFLEVKTGKFWPMHHELDDDTEFHLLKPHSTDGQGEPLLPWKSYHDWLRLMIHYFDAIHVLDNHLMALKSSPIDISIKILYPPLPDHEMLPRQDLPHNEKYFPPIQNNPGQPSAAELITFLTSPTLVEEGTSVQDLIDDVYAAMQKQEREIVGGVAYNDLAEDIEILLEGVNELKDYSSAGWKDYDYVVAVLRQVEALRSDDTPHGRLSRLKGVSGMLETLKGSFSVYKRLQPGTPLSLGSGFIGAGHCEVCAGCVNSLSGTPGPHVGLSKDLLEEFRVCHIFVPCLNLCQILQYRKPDKSSECRERCCPACARLLSLLKPNDHDKFLTTGNHSTIIACTLPEYLSEQIIDQIAVEFGLRLRKELVNLQKTAAIQRARARTSYTRRISMESLILTERERVNGSLPNFTAEVAQVSLNSKPYQVR